jgi:ParB family chromosome partitioning protein
MASKQKHGLGSGLSALIPQNIDASKLSETFEKVHKLALELIEPNKDQPRKHFDESSLSELAESIKQHGVIQPIVVSPLKNGNYLLIAGERRLRAAKLAGENTIPAIVRSIKELERLEMAMIENVQRVDLSPIEQAMSIEHLHQQFSMTYEMIARKLGKALSTVNNIARLLQLPKEVIDALNKKIITEGHARAILALKDYPEYQKILLNNCINGWSVRQAERYVTSIKSGAKTDSEARAKVAVETPDTKSLSSSVGTQVHIRRMAKGGRLEITFSSDEELARLIRRIAKTA